MKEDDKPRFPIVRVAYVSPLKGRAPTFAYSTFRAERNTSRAVPPYAVSPDDDTKPG